jgi:ADP-ribose pyrophosphatase YjhB (NUDIX family)
VSDTRLYPTHPLIAASLAVFKDGKVLLAARKETAASPIYSLPGGLVEIGETLHEAAIREVLEETSITARAIGFVDTHEIIDRDPDQRIRRHFIIHTFVGQWVSGEAQTSAEAPHVRWQDPHVLGGIVLTKGLQPLLLKAAAQFQSIKLR